MPSADVAQLVRWAIRYHARQNSESFTNSTLPDLFGQATRATILGKALIYEFTFGPSATGFTQHPSLADFASLIFEIIVCPLTKMNRGVGFGTRRRRLLSADHYLLHLSQLRKAKALRMDY
jgi:hypothetical protein